MNKQIILIVILLVAVGATAYVLLAKQGSDPAIPSTENASQNGKFGTQIQNLRRIKTLQINTSIFSNPIFQSLTTDVAPSIDTGSIQKGRQNPFLPF